MEQTLLLFRSLFLTGCGVAGWYIAKIHHGWEEEPWFGCFLGLAAGLFVILVDRLIKGVSLRAFSSATFGLILGCVLATLVWASGLFSYAGEDVQWVIRLVIYLVFGYLGTMLALRSNRDEFSLIIPYVRLVSQESSEQVLLLDTSAIVDGRIGDLCKAGFLRGIFVIPRFILNELQTLGDSADAGRRQRGRRGLDLLNELKGLPQVTVRVHETEESDDPVDTRLIHLARILKAQIVTTDYNLSRIAELQKIHALNIHHLANVLRVPLTAGQHVFLRLIREGKEPHQGVGFLEDGTMIVVNQARALVGQEAEVVIAGAIQTTAGRMIFAELIRDGASPSAMEGRNR